MKFVTVTQLVVAKSEFCCKTKGAAVAGKVRTTDNEAESVGATGTAVVAVTLNKKKYGPALNQPPPLWLYCDTPSFQVEPASRPLMGVSLQLYALPPEVSEFVTTIQYVVLAASSKPPAPLV